MPKGFRKQIKLTSQKVGVERREELLANIADGNGFLPQGVHIKDMDASFVDFVKEKLKIDIDGEEVPVIFLTIQRYADFTKTWKFTDEFKNIKMPFITIVRNPDIQKGTNYAGLANIPEHQHWSYYKVPTNDGARVGMDIYKIPQPTSVDITYEVRFFSNKMSDVNVIHNKVQREFNATQSYIYPKGHFMPITVPTISDESNIEDFESRRFYVQTFEMLLAGYILDENDFEVQPTINRAMVLNEIAVDPATAEPQANPNRITPVIRTQGSVIIRNSAGQLIATTNCGTPYIVGNSEIINSGSTFSVSVPATSGYTLPNITHYDCDGLPIILPAQTSFSATPFCMSGTVVNSGITYSATVAAGGTLELPNINVLANSVPLYLTASVIDVDIDVRNGFNIVGSTSGTSWFISASTISNTSGTYSQNIPAESGFTLPNITNYDSDGSPVVTPAQVGFTATTCPTGSTIYNSTSGYTQQVLAGSNLTLPDTPIFSTSSGFTDTTPSVSTGYTIPDITWVDSDSVTATTEYGNVITCTPVTPTLVSDIRMYSDSGATSAITATTYDATVYLKIDTTGATGIEYYNFTIPQLDGHSISISQTGDTYTWVVGAYGDWSISGSVKDTGVATAYNVTPADVHLAAAAYERPSDWLPLPTITGGTSTEEINGLFAVWDREHNYVTVQCTGAFTVNWGDGAGDINYGTGVIAERDISYSATSSATTTSDGYRQVLIQVTPQGGSNITNLDLAEAHTNSDPITSFGWLDIQMRAENLTTLRIKAGTILPLQLEQFDFLGDCGRTTYISVFQDCTALKSVPNLATNSATDMSSCFRGCYSLTNVGEFDLGVGTNFGLTFYNCRALKYLKLTAPAATTFSNTFGLTYSLVTVDLMETSLVTTFDNCFNTSKIVYLNALDTSSCTSFFRMFLGASGLRRLPIFDAGLVTSTNEMLRNATAFLEFPQIDFPSLTSMSDMFNAAQSLRYIPAFDIGSVTVWTTLFANCLALETVGLFDTSNITSFSSTFSGCFSLSEVPLFDTSNVTTFDSAFQNCKSLLEVPLFDTSSAIVLRRMFNGCVSLIKTPAFDTTINASLAETFRQCAALQEVNLTNWSACTNVGTIFVASTRVSRVRNCNVPITISFNACQMESAELEEIYTDLPVVVGQTITVTGNPGAGTADTTIATAKGWAVVT